MAQDPFLIDQVQIEPAAAGTRLIRRAADGSLEFLDAILSGGITLQKLAGLGSLANVLVVGKSGAGAHYTTIQSALDAVPSAASAANPYLVLVLPGVYTETVNIVRDGVRLIGLGLPTIESALEATPDAPGADHTVILSAQLGTIPLSTVIQGFTITNAHTNKACIRIVGTAGSTVGSDGIFIRGCNLQANSASGNRNIWASTVNQVFVEGGAWHEANNLGLLLLQEVAYFEARGVAYIGAVECRYDTANDQPNLGAIAYRFTNCGPIAESTLLGIPVAVDLDGGGGLVFENCSLPVQVNFSGNRNFAFRNCIVAILLLTETVACVAENTVVQSLAAPAAGAILNLRSLAGTAAFAAVTDVDVTFDVPMSDANYQVHWELPSQPVNDETPWITNKAATGFKLNFATAQNMNALWRAVRSDV